MPERSWDTGAPRARPHGARHGWPTLAAVTVATSLAVASPAISIPGGIVPRGFLAARLTSVLEDEAQLLRLPSAESARSLAQAIGSRPAIAGTASMADSAAQLKKMLQGWGLEVTTHEYEVFMPHAVRVSLQRLEPEPLDLPLDELALGSDPDFGDDHYPAVAGYSAAGDVTAGVVYVNYGRPKDFAALPLVGTSVEGKVALLRYGEGFRGAKVSNAIAAGASAVLLYSDPQEDGYYRGDVYPEGPFRPRSGIQRGSVKVGAPGDPTTPGWPSLPGAERVEPSDSLPQIPVVPISYGAATEIMRDLGGPEVPAGWQGALPFRYHVGSGVVQVRVQVELDAQPFKRIRNTVGWLRGSVSPDQWVIVGAHRDSWTNGAIDNVSGTVSVLEAARSLAAMRDLGRRPRRTIVFAFWDAEEWGLLGSAEWVEELDEELSRSAVAYINQDGIAGGPFFGAVASPSLVTSLLEVVDAVPDPVLPSSSVYSAWKRRAGAGPDGRLPIAPPGGGSDYASFLGRHGIPSVGFGFSGAHGVYHSAYDTAEFMRRFGDPGYRQHRAAATITALLAWRLADADLLPFDYVEYADTLGAWLLRIEREVEARWDGRVSMQRLQTALTRLQRVARDYEAASGAAVQASRSTGLANADRVNEQLLQVSRQMIARADARSWYRNLVMAPDPTDAYAVLPVPEVSRAVAAGDPLATMLRIEELARRLDAARGFLKRAVALLGREVVADIPADY